MLPKVLLGSLSFICRHPGFFVPRLINVTIWNFIYIYLLYGIYNFYLTYEITYIYSSMAILPVAFVFSQFSIILSSMYPTLVKYYRKNGEFKFLLALKIALKKYPNAFVCYMLPSFLMGLFIFPFAILIGYGLIMNAFLYLTIGIIFSVLIILGFCVVFYFAPAAVILEKVGPLNAMRDGIRLSKKHVKEVTFLTLFSYSLLFLALMFEGTFKELGILGFFLGRYIGAVFSTYILVINPNMYLEVK